MKTIRKIKHKIFSLVNNGRFKTFQEAFEYCEKKNRVVYQSDLICKYRFHKLKNFLNEGGNLLCNPGMPNLLLTINFFYKNFDIKCPALIDFGGASGESLLMLEKIFGTEITKKSYIIETPKHVAESKNWVFVSKINFSSDISNILKNKNLSIFYSTGTIQYLEDPFQIISEVAESSIKIASFTRNNFALKNKIYVQKSYLSENGYGNHLKEYKDIPFYYPNRSIIKKELVNIFLKNNFKIIFDAQENTGVLGANNYGGDLIFAKDN